MSELYEFDRYCYYTWQHVLIVIMCDTNVCLDCCLSKLKGGIFNAQLWTMFPNMKCKYFRSSSRKVCAVGWIGWTMTVEIIINQQNLIYSEKSLYQIETWHPCQSWTVWCTFMSILGSNYNHVKCESKFYSSN